MAAMFAYPLLGHAIFDGRPDLAGYFLGTAIHDTSQVTGAGLMYVQQFDQPAALDVAVVTKLLRNICLVAVVPVMAYLYHRHRPADAGQPRRVGWRNAVPLFVVGFLAMTLLRTAGDAADGSYRPLGDGAWPATIGLIENAAAWCLMLAMAAVGLGTDLKRLMGLGVKPFAAGLLAALLAGAVSLGLIFLCELYLG